MPDPIIPPYIVQKNDLKNLTELKKGSGSNKMYVGTLACDGVEKKVFFKPIVLSSDNDKEPTYLSWRSQNYLPVTAKYVVAASLAGRMLGGPILDENRLVYENGQIVGTVSFALDDFKPLALRGLFPLTTHDRSNPSVEMLLDSNVALLLTLILFLLDDDPHAENLTFIENKSTDKNKNQYVMRNIDHDCKIFKILEIIRGERLTNGVIQTSMSRVDPYDKKNITNFPNIVGPTHFPSMPVPQNGNFLKICAANESFRDLAKEPLFHLQYLKAMFQILVLYNPDSLREALTSYFGDEPLNYREGLADDKVKLLEKTFPELFNETRNKGSFVDHFLAMFQEQLYDPFYRAVVFYSGGTNTFGISIPSFQNFLSENKQCFHEIVEDSPWLTNKDKDYAENRYHKIFRDGLVLSLPGINNLFLKAFYDIRQALIKSDNNNQDEVLQQVNLSLTTITEAKDLLPSLFGVVNEKIQCEETNDIGIAYKSMCELYGTWKAAVTEYFEVTDVKSISVSQNSRFLRAITDAMEKHQRAITKGLMGTSWANQASNIFTQLHNFLDKANFSRKVYEKSAVPLIALSFYSAKQPALDHIDSMRNLFDEVQILVNKISPEKFNKIIEDACDTYSKSSIINKFTQTRIRDLVIKPYLKNSLESNRDKLRYILSWGESNKGSLNPILVECLLNDLTKNIQVVVPPALTVFKTAFERKEIKSSVYEKYAGEWQRLITKDLTKSNVFFPSDDSTNWIPGYLNTMFHWVEKIDSLLFSSKVNNAIDDYDRNTWTGSKKKELVKIVNLKKSNSEKLRDLILCGGIDTNSSGTILLKELNKFFFEWVEDKKDNKEMAAKDFPLLLKMHNDHFSQKITMSAIKDRVNRVFSDYQNELSSSNSKLELKMA